MSTLDPEPRDERASQPSSQFFASPAFSRPPGQAPSEYPEGQYPPGVFPPGYYPPRDPMVEFREHLAELTPHVYVTWILLGVNVVVFLAMAIGGVSLVDPKSPELVRWGANFGPQTLGGEWWRILTCTFVHIGIIHIAMNMFCLATAGPMVERMLGNTGFAILYLVAGLGGSVASLFWNPMVASAGASGAIFGIYGALLALMLRQHGAIPAEALTQVRNSGLAFVGYNLIFGFAIPFIDNAAHLGGLATGFLCGLVLSQPLDLESVDWRWLRNLLALAAGAVLVGGGAAYVQTSYADVPRSHIALERFQVVEPKAIAAFKAAFEKKLSDAAFVDVLEKEILPDWRDLNARFANLQRLPASRRRLVAAVAEYVRLREEAWEAFRQGARESSREKIAEANGKMKLADEATKAIAAAAGK